MKFTICQDSRVGRRKSNQDRIAYCYSRDALLMVVADGMGGHRHGEIAAALAVRCVTEAFRREAQPVLADVPGFMSRALVRAHAAIIDHTFDHRLADAPRTTIVACIVQGGVACWAHAGDSRLYLLRERRVAARTRDHSRVQLLVDQGVISPQAATTHPQRHRVYSCLGGDHAPKIETSKPVALRDGDMLALCTDGVWGPLGDDGLLAGLAGTRVIESVPKLMRCAERLAGERCDNLSMIAMTWHDETAATDEDSVVSTRRMPLDEFTMKPGNPDPGRVAPGNGELSDDKTGRALAEINPAIQKYRQESHASQPA